MIFRFAPVRIAKAISKKQEAINNIFRNNSIRTTQIKSFVSKHIGGTHAVVIISLRLRGNPPCIPLEHISRLPSGVCTYREQLYTLQVEISSPKTAIGAFRSNTLHHSLRRSIEKEGKPLAATRRNGL
jgi:hypothetical protein